MLAASGTIILMDFTHASRPAGKPQYPMTCIKHSLISSTFSPLSRPILTCDFICWIFPVLARILLGHQPASFRLCTPRRRRNLRNDCQTAILFLQPRSVPYSSETALDQVLVSWAGELRLCFNLPIRTAGLAHIVQLNA